MTDDRQTTSSQAIRRLHTISADPRTYVRDWKARTGGKVIGTLCSYAPEELILAGGALGVRILGGSGITAKADTHLQSYSCSLVRSALDQALSGRLDFLDGVIFPHTCDSIQRLSDIWRMSAATGFHLDVVLPVKFNTPSALNYLLSVMTSTRSELERLLGKPITEDDLAGAIDTLNGIRRIIQHLYTIRWERPGAIAGGDLHTIVRASMIMDRHDFLHHLSQVEDEIVRQTDGQAATGKRIFLSGGICNLPDVYSLIEAAGGTVVGDDLCTGSRGVTGLIDTAGDPLKAIADRYLRRVVCPAKHTGITSRGDDLVSRVAESRAQGVIFLLLKFCDPHAFDYPFLKARLAEVGIPSLLMELEEQSVSQGQFRTRCEAFLEML
jgi:benzoyl-CoA reductase subunit C